VFNILVCEDDKNIRNLMSIFLKKENFNVYEAEDGQKALDILDTVFIDLIITDIMMPKIDGYELSNDLRKAGIETPILMITAKETIEDKRQGFKIGVDDYMVKPIDMDEMILRVEALLRRSKAVSGKVLKVGETVLDFDALTVNGAELPKKEFMLLFKLLSSTNHIFTRSQLMDEIWGYDSDSDEQTVNVHISRIREKFESNEDFEILTVKGLGFKAVTK
jgi:DNA-binding response OmpR family regulator